MKGVELIQCTSVFDEQGVFSPKFSDAKGWVEGDQVIMAVGQSPDLAFLENQDGIAVRAGLVAVDEVTLQAGIHGVYAGGDLIDQPRSVAHAIGSGKRAAMAMDLYLTGQPGLDRLKDSRIGHHGEISFTRYLGDTSPLESRDVVRFEDLNPDYFQTMPRYEKPRIAQGEPKGFQELYGNLTPESAAAEAQRCFTCGWCDQCGHCVVFCPDIAVSFNDSPYPEANYDYCKGCGICAVECPKGVISMTRED
jgi:Pyruvate/2-oxoacid:ferredoxin oxidoreductase delta subunit